MRIQEERERRDKRAQHLARLPAALQELHDQLAECVSAYTGSFGASSADIVMLPNRIRVTSRELIDGSWKPAAKVEVSVLLELPGFQIERGEIKLEIEVGLLPSDKLFYRDKEADKYINMEEFTRRILDRVLFPGLKEQ
ncbi:MAG: hypothetical protein ABI759_10705 [Candidatus Solibacter sp.]